MSSNLSARMSSSRSMSSVSVGSLALGGRTRISYSPSMYVGSAGYGTRTSSSSSSMSLGSYMEGAVINNEKVTMQNLNDRLASYLNQVRSLEAANRKLELQIKEYYEKRAPGVARDLTKYYVVIGDLRTQIQRRFTDSQTITLQIDNAQMAVEDFKTKHEMEATMRMNVEGDIARLRGFKDSLGMAISDLKLQLEGLTEELAYMKSSHEEEMRLARTQMSGDVNVEVDSRSGQVDLMKVLEEMRVQYESVMIKNKQDQEKWFNEKMEELQTQIVTRTTEVKTSSSELSELKRSSQSLEITRQSLFTELQCLQQSLEEVKSRYGLQLSQIQVTITAMETELQQLRTSIETQQCEYQVLLDIKMRLELEIAEYRRLLDGEYVDKKAVIITKKVEEPKHKIERRVKVITEQIIDGKVVSSVVDTQTEEVNTAAVTSTTTTVN